MTETASEAQLQQAIVDAARVLGWRVAHFRPARTNRGWRTPLTGDAGFPDLILARRGRVLALELKSQKGRVDAEQHAWLDELAGGRIRALLVRPTDLDQILEMLR